MARIVKLQVKRWERDGREYRTYLVTAPKALVEMLGWREGDMLRVSVDEGKLVFERISRPVRRMAKLDDF